MSRMSHKIEKLHEVKIKHPTGAARRASESGQTLVEVMVAMAVLGFMMVALYAGFSSGFAVVRVSRENLRATQSWPKVWKSPDCTIGTRW